jgi:hypothetical protein
LMRHVEGSDKISNEMAQKRGVSYLHNERVVCMVLWKCQ